MIMIRRFVLSAIISIDCAGAAVATDFVPSRKSPPPSPPPAAFTWDGFYLGGQIGGGRATDKLSQTDAFDPTLQLGYASLGASGIIGGAHAGYNWQFGSIVTGLEGDIEGTSLSKSSNCLGLGSGIPGGIGPRTWGDCDQATGYSFGTALPWQGSARARLGYAFGNVLVYGTGGVAIADVSTRYAVSSPIPIAVLNGAQSFDQTKVGATIGAGVEYAIDANWSARAEYRFSDFGKVSDAPTSAGLWWYGMPVRHTVEENAVLFGVSYKFGAPAVAARY
jgi:outer membrane immunogenic protein